MDVVTGLKQQEQDYNKDYNSVLGSHWIIFDLESGEAKKAGTPYNQYST